MSGLADRVAIVTGAAGGLGRAIVAALRAERARVVAEDIAETVGELETPDGTVVALRGDVSRAETADAAVALALERFGTLDVLVNNAGRGVFRPLLETTDEDFDGLMSANVRGCFVHCRAAIGALTRSEAGAIVNISSISGLVGLPEQAAYCATKGAIVQLTRSIAIEFAASGVRVNAVAPGAIHTPLLVQALGGGDDLEEGLKAVASHHPMGRYSTPDEIAAVVVFLASPAASFITGAIVAADGGYTAA